MTTERTVRLRFGQDSREAQTHTNLSAVRAEGRCLWVAGDETATIERLVSDEDGTEYAGQRTWRLADLVPLPGGPDDEADVEGLARGGRWLWAVGSHSLKRRQAKSSHGDAKAVRRLATVVQEPNRKVLVRIPVVVDDDGLPALAQEVTVDGERLRAAVLSGEDGLLEALDGDDHLDPFLKIPGKDNGLDIEGVADHGDRVYLGLRGPVLRGWATLLEIRPQADPDEPSRLRLRPLDGGRELYRKHFLDLDGLGIRDLLADGDDLLVLAGPSMDLSGPVRVYRWRGAASAEAGQVVRSDELTRLLDLPHGDGEDHAEGTTLLGDGDDRRLLVVYDSPGPDRRCEDGVLADVVALPG